jgi:diaminohydroxyphosphoribosylaminopyrimidine deaminase/5-amino-6-(5-phosphoribosylamino)uracil reductase
MPREARLLTSASQTPLWIVTGEDADEANSRALTACGAKTLPVPSVDGKLDLTAVLTRLAGRGITRLMVEAGPILSAALLAADLVDEAVLFRSSRAIGPQGLDALEGMPLAALTRSPRLQLIETGMTGEDTVERFARSGD